eukprot:TRINITY_DN9768_c0_g1_i2.p1 TRINITY_DN9768_c0_g1~~TRINITY_DN9768_c0_g1_i2.p1  ORF type:complete len:256 (-),score=59.66 TRINITY_DN9768_c0_g1_i2:13-780(-)
MAQASVVAEVQRALTSVRQNISQLVQRLQLRKEPTLVAVSKTKPNWMLQAAYDIGHRHFGENYVQEIVSKAPALPADIRWHFIGHLQSNKCKTLLEIPNLWAVETVDSEKLATQLNKACVSVGRPDKLRIFIQINTSAEDSKYGIAPNLCRQLARFVTDNCPQLNLVGLMTIGRFDPVPNPECFQVLLDCRQQVAEELKVEANDLELSMGMSGDYELAVEMGSTNIRVGSTIFGHRDYSQPESKSDSVSEEKASS